MKIKIEADENIDLEEIIKNREIKYTKFNTKNFINVDILLYILYVGGGVTVVEISKILVSLIKKNEVKSVKIGDKEIKGYSAKEVDFLLSNIYKRENNPGNEGPDDEV